MDFMKSRRFFFAFCSRLQENPNERPSENCGEERRPTEFPWQLRKKLNTKYCAVLLPSVTSAPSVSSWKLRMSKNFRLFVLCFSLLPYFYKHPFPRPHAPSPTPPSTDRRLRFSFRPDLDRSKLTCPDRVQFRHLRFCRLLLCFKP